MVQETNNLDGTASLSPDTRDMKPIDEGFAEMDITVDGKEITEPQAGQEPVEFEQESEVEPLEDEVQEEVDGVKEDLIAGKFKSQEDLEKAYKELESKFGQTSQEKVNLQKALETLAPVFEENNLEQPAMSVDDPEVQLENIVGRAISKAMAPQQANLAIEQLANKYPDFENYADDMVRVAQEMPELILKDKASGLERAYRIAKADRFEAEKQQAKQDGKKEAYQSIAKKVTSGVESASKAGDRSGSLSMADFNKLSLQEQEKIILNIPGVSNT